MASKSKAGRDAGKEATKKKATGSSKSTRNAESIQDAESIQNAENSKDGRGSMGAETATVAGSFEKAGKALAGFRIVEVTEEDKKLRRRANRIRKAMLQDLQARGLTATKAMTGGGAAAGAGDRDRGAIYTDMVEDYVALWITRERLEADIAERGVTVFDEKRGLPVENCSVSARVRVSKQMTTIMQTLGYKDQAIKARRPEGDADDEL